MAFRAAIGITIQIPLSGLEKALKQRGGENVAQKAADISPGL